MATRQCSSPFRQTNASFLCQLAELGCQLDCPTLRFSARALLKLMPVDAATLATIRRVAGEVLGGKAGMLEQCLVTQLSDPVPA